MTVHDVFHVPNLQKCLSGEANQVPLEDIHVADRLHFVEEPIEIIAGKVKQLRHHKNFTG